MLFLVSPLALAPAATLVHGGATQSVWNVQRLKQVCGKGGCITEFYINGEIHGTGDPFASPVAREFDSHCTGLGFGDEWMQCQSQIPYTPEGQGGFAKLSAWNATSKTADVWFTWLNPFGAKTVNETGCLVVEAVNLWDVAKCRQMMVVSKTDV